MQLTRNEIIELRARAICKAVAESENKLTLKPNVKDINKYTEDNWKFFICEAKAAIEADEKAGVLILVDDEPKDGDLGYSSLVGLSSFYLPNNSWWNYSDKEHKSNLIEHKIIQRNNTPVYQCKKEETNV